MFVPTILYLYFIHLTRLYMSLFTDPLGFVTILFSKILNTGCLNDLINNRTPYQSRSVFYIFRPSTFLQHRPLQVTNEVVAQPWKQAYLQVAKKLWILEKKRHRRNSEQGRKRKGLCKLSEKMLPFKEGIMSRILCKRE